MEAFRSLGRLTGFTSEAAAAIVLESESHAKQREARVYARLDGYAIKSDAALPGDHRVEGDAHLRAMREVLGPDAHLPDAIWGASSDYDGQTAFTSIVDAFGETYGAAAALNLAGALLQMEAKANVETSDITSSTSRVVVNARNIGGTAVSILLEKS